MKYGFIGAGNMASAIIRGLVAGGVSPQTVYVSSKEGKSACALAQELDICACGDASAVIRNTDIVVFAVKPNVLSTLLPMVKEDIFAAKPLVVSVAAGRPISFFEEKLNKEVPIVRAMPNINAMAGASCTALCKNEAATEENLQQVRTIFEAVGEVVSVAEKEFGVFSAIAGSAPAFAFIYMDTLARAALRAGMPKNTALAIAAQTVMGSAKMVLKSNLHPWELADRVCSPGGTTVEGVKTLLDSGFESAVMRAVEAVIEKEKKL